jgi:general secretion pathway protein J
MTRGNRSGSRGFTLFEVLIAMFIFGVVVTTVFGSYRTVFSSVDALQARIDLNEMATVCFNRLGADLRSAFVARGPAYEKPGFDDPPDPYRFAMETVYEAGGNFPRLRFTSFAHLPMGADRRTGIAEIVYYVESEGAFGEAEESRVLKRGDRLPPYPENFEAMETDPVLCERVRSLQMVLLDAEGEEHESWDSEATEQERATPRAVAVTLELGDENVSLFYETVIEIPVYRDAVE